MAQKTLVNLIDPKWQFACFLDHKNPKQIETNLRHHELGVWSYSRRKVKREKREKRKEERGK